MTSRTPRGLLLIGATFALLALPSIAQGFAIDRGGSTNCNRETGWCSWTQRWDIRDTAPLVGRRARAEVKPLVKGYIGSEATIRSARTTERQPVTIVATGSVIGTPDYWRIVARNIDRRTVGIKASGRYCLRVPGYTCYKEA